MQRVQTENLIIITIPFPDEIKANQYELSCKSCGKRLYVDAETYYNAVGTVENGYDNPFTCKSCGAEKYKGFVNLRQRTIF